MKFHQAGKLIIFVSIVTIALTSLFYVLLLAHLWWVNLIFFTIMFVLCVLIVRFFRVPTRVINKVDDGVLSPADGTIVYVGTAFEHGDQRVGEVWRRRLLVAEEVHHVVLQSGKALDAQYVVCGGEPGHKRGDII